MCIGGQPRIVVLKGTSIKDVPLHDREYTEIDAYFPLIRPDYDFADALHSRNGGRHDHV